MMPRMFYALFSLCAVLPLFRLVAELRGIKEPDPWKVAVRVMQWARLRNARKSTQAGEPTVPGDS